MTAPTIPHRHFLIVTLFVAPLLNVNHLAGLLALTAPIATR
jgi:hypothetical protein